MPRARPVWSLLTSFRQVDASRSIRKETHVLRVVQGMETSLTVVVMMLLGLTPEVFGIPRHRQDAESQPTTRTHDRRTVFSERSGTYLVNFDCSVSVAIMLRELNLLTKRRYIVSGRTAFAIEDVLVPLRKSTFNGLEDLETCVSDALASVRLSTKFLGSGACEFAIVSPAEEKPPPDATREDVIDDALRNLWRSSAAQRSGLAIQLSTFLQDLSTGTGATFCCPFRDAPLDRGTFDMLSGGMTPSAALEKGMAFLQQNGLSLVKVVGGAGDLYLVFDSVLDLRFRRIETIHKIEDLPLRESDDPVVMMFSVKTRVDWIVDCLRSLGGRHRDTFVGAVQGSRSIFVLAPPKTMHSLANNLSLLDLSRER